VPPVDEVASLEGEGVGGSWSSRSAASSDRWPAAIMRAPVAPKLSAVTAASDRIASALSADPSSARATP
jgi:hypothetical protein